VHAVILAAGRGRRISRIWGRPKCLLKVGGETILERQLRSLEGVCRSVVIVVGYKAEEVVESVARGDIRFVFNGLWGHSNTLTSLLFGVSAIDEDVLVVNGDTVFSMGLLKQMVIQTQRSWTSIAAVQKLDEVTDEEVKVKCDERGRVIEIGKQCPGVLEAVGVYLLKASLVYAVQEIVAKMEDPMSAYYEDAINLVLPEHPMYVCPTEGAIEIDTPDDYQKAAESLGGDV